MGSSGYTCIRRTFCCLNVLVMFCGALFLASGLWLHLSYQGYATLYPSHIGLSIESLFILIGALSIVISFFGCCGSFFESRCCLIIYFSLIIILFLSEFIVGALVFLFRSGITRALTMDIKDGIVKHYNSTDQGSFVAPSVSKVWDNLQNELQCCGVNSYEDWYHIDNWKTEKWVPKSCCRSRHTLSPDLYEGSGYEEDDCRKKQKPELWWSQGCARALQLLLIRKLHVVGIISIVIAFFQLFGLIISMLLFCTIKHKRKSDTYKSYSPTVDSSAQRQSYLDD